jgi:hypothetical protein
VDRCRKKRARKICNQLFGNCTNDWPPCGTCTNGNLSGAYCFIELGTAKVFCGTNSYCSQISTCADASECPKGSFCATLNGCTGCGYSYGVCIPLCCHSTGDAGGPRRRLCHLGRTAAG